jgi:prepilin-type N-terminal cleavage/methylation domain-containing protein
MRYSKYTSAGFTIVELLVVVVVIAILAAIALVSYNGIQSRANDTAVRSDISNMAKKLQLYYTEYGTYPDTNIPADVSKAFTGFRASKGSYVTSGTNVNLAYCTNLPDRNQFAIIGWSKSSSTKGFYITNTKGLSEFNYALSSGDIACDNAGVGNNRAWMWMYDVLVSSGWRSFM